MIEVDHLTRLYTRRERARWFKRGPVIEILAVTDMSFAIKPGERVAFIGPNGAGKTTTLRMLTGLLYPTSGMARVNGLVPWDQRQELSRSMGLVFGQRSQLWMDLPVVQSFEALSVIYALPRAAFEERCRQLVATLQLGDFMEQPARSLSLGQRMRCEIAASLLHRPKVLFLDEPTIGLDVEAKAILRDYLRELNRLEDTTILLTSHDTGDIEDICDRVIMIDHGRKILDQPLAKLQSEFDAKRRLVLTTHDARAAIVVPDVVIDQSMDHRVVIEMDTRRQKLADIIAAVQAQVDIDDLVIERASLESIIRELYARGAMQ